MVLLLIGALAAAVVADALDQLSSWAATDTDLHGTEPHERHHRP